jgi:hypothetical protein
MLPVLFLLLLAGPAAAKDNFTSLDDVDTGDTESLDSVDTGHTESLDEVDTGGTEDLDSVDTGDTESLDSVDTGRTESLDEVDTGRTYSADEAKFGTVPDRPGPVPQAEFAGPLADVWQTRLSIAYREVVKEGQRYHDADVAYIDMRRTGYPTGDARVEVARAYAAARRSLEGATAHYAELVKRAKKAAR